MNLFDCSDPEEVSKNIKRQATKLLACVAESYNTGILDDPHSAFNFCSLLACICEGKVQGRFDTDTGIVNWSLTQKYQEELKTEMARQAQQHPNVVKGPW